MACCKRCARKRKKRRSKISGIMRSRRSVNRMVMPIAGATVGFVGGHFLSRIPQLQSYGSVVAVGKIIGGTFIAVQKGKISTAVGTGLAVNGAIDLVNQFLFSNGANGNGNDSVSGIGLGRQGVTRQVHRIAGRGRGMGQGSPSYNRAPMNAGSHDEVAA